MDRRQFVVGVERYQLDIDDRHRSIVSLFDLTERDRRFEGWRAGYLPEQQLAPLLIRWRAFGPTLPANEIAQLRALCESTPTF